MSNPIVKERSVYFIEISKEVYEKAVKLADYSTLMLGPHYKDMYTYNHRLYTSQGSTYYQVSFDADMTIDQSLL